MTKDEIETGEKPEEEIVEDEESLDLDKILEEKGYVSKEELEKQLAGFEKKKTRAIKKKKEEKPPKKEERVACPKGCGGELKLTAQGWFKCQKCGKGFFIKG